MTAPANPTLTPSVFGSSSTDHFVSMPETVAEGRLIVAFISTVTDLPATPSGWTLIESVLNSLGRLSQFALETTGEEGGTTVNFATESEDVLIAHVHYFSEAGYTIADCVSAASLATGSSSAPNPPSRTTGWGSTDFVTLAAAAAYGPSAAPAAPSGYSGLADDLAGALILMSAYKASTGASSEDPGTFTISGTAFLWVAGTVCVRLNPSPPAPDPPTISDVDPDTFAWGEQIVISGADFEAVKGSGKVEISDNATYASGTKVIQTSVSWGDGEITINTVQGAHGAGTHYVWVTNDTGDRNATGFEVTATEDEPTPPPASPASTVLYGALQVQIYGSPPVGAIDEVLAGATIVEGVRMIPSASFSAPKGAAGVALAVAGAEIGIRRQGEGEIFRGTIERINEVVGPAGDVVVEFECLGLGRELANLTTARSTLVLGESLTSAMSAILSGSGWTAKVTGSGYLDVTKEWINRNRLAALAELAEIANAYWRFSDTTREFEIINTNPDSGIVLGNFENLDPTSARVGMIAAIRRYERDASTVVNRVEGEIKTDSARLITLQESTRSSPFTITAAFKRAARYVDHVADVVRTGAFETILNALGENRYALIELLSDNIDANSIARLGGQFTAQLELVPDAGGDGVTIGLWGGIPPKGAPAVDVEVEVPSVTYAFGLTFENVDQVSPIRESDYADDVSSSPSITIDSAVGDLVIGALLMRTAGAATITPTAGQTLIGANASGADTNAITLWQLPGAATSTTLTWTINSSRSWAAFAISLKPARRYYIEDTTSQAAYGVRELPIALGSFGQVEVDNEALANAAYDYLADYLTRNKDPLLSLELDCSFLPGTPLDWLPGDTMAVKYRSADLTIDDDLIAVKRTQTFDRAGARSWVLEFSDRAQFRRDEIGAWLMQHLIDRMITTQANQV